MPKFRLPKGYSFDPPAVLDAQAQILIDRQKLYGGADISDAWDAAGAHWTFCNATFETLFRFRAFEKKRGETVYTERPLLDSVDGRGNADVQWFDGMAHYSCWQGQQFYQNIVPGFVAFPSIPSLAARIAQLEEVGPSGGGTPSVARPFVIPANGAIAALWPLAYGPSEVDSPEEIAVKFNKLKAAVFEILMGLKEAGTFV